MLETIRLMCSVKRNLKLVVFLKNRIVNWRLLPFYQFIMCDAVLSALEWNAAI